VKLKGGRWFAVVAGCNLRHQCPADVILYGLSPEPVGLPWGVGYHVDTWGEGRGGGGGGSGG
jgi:hypothetical protein